MNTLTYRCLGDHITYVMTCKDDALDAYMKMMFDEDLDVYKVNLNDEAFACHGNGKLGFVCIACLLQNILIL